MQTTIQAVYENGSLRPLEPLRLAEGARVEITVTPLEAGEEATEAQQAAEMLAAIAALPLESDDSFSNRDHDEMLYGEERKR